MKGSQIVDFLEKCLLYPHKTADLVLCQQAYLNWSASLSFGPAGYEAWNLFMHSIFDPGLDPYRVQVTV